MKNNHGWGLGEMLLFIALLLFFLLVATFYVLRLYGGLAHNNQSVEIESAVNEYLYKKYGSKILWPDYINAGMLWMNMKKIKETGMLEKARELIKTKKFVFADQTAVYKATTKKLLLHKKYGSQNAPYDLMISLDTLKEETSLEISDDCKGYVMVVYEDGASVIKNKISCD